MLVMLKINGQELQADTSKMDESWIAKCLAYGVRRLPNDTYSGEKGATKYDLVSKLIADMESGEPAPVRVQGSGRSPANPVEALARKNAKADLTGMFRAVTDKTKAIDFAQHEKVAPFFTIVKGDSPEQDRAVWNEETVTAWMAKQKDAKKRDYLADAAAIIESASSTPATAIEALAVLFAVTGSAWSAEAMFAKFVIMLPEVPVSTVAWKGAK